MAKRYIRLKEVLNRIPVCKSTWWQWCKDGKAPQPVKLSTRTVVWIESEIDEFQEHYESKRVAKPSSTPSSVGPNV